MKSIFFNRVMSALVMALFWGLILTPIVSLAHDEHGAHEEAAGGHHYVPKPRTALTAPAAHYSGATAVDRTNGNFFNVGTYGVPNVGYEQWAKGSTWAVSLAEQPYSYDQKERFITTLDERIRHYETAQWNYEQVTDTVSKPEGKAHAQKAIEELKPRIEKARNAFSKAKSANRGEWDGAQVDAKKAFLDLQNFYYGMHKNVFTSTKQ